MNVLDFVWPIVVILGFVFGYRKGFFASVTRPIKFLASISLTVLVALPVINLIKPFFTDKIFVWMSTKIEEAGVVDALEIPKGIKFLADLLRIEVSEITSVDVLVSDLSSRVGGFISIIISYVCLFIIFMLLLTLVIALLNLAFNKGILKKINKILGVLLGGVIAAVAACVLVNIVGAFAPGAIEGPISQFFSRFNPVTILFGF